MLDAITSQAQRRHALLTAKLEDLDLPGTGAALRDLTTAVRSELEA